MDKKWLIGGLTVPALLSLGVLVFGAYFGRVPALDGVVGITVTPPAVGASGIPRYARNEDAFVRAAERDEAADSFPERVASRTASQSVPGEIVSLPSGILSMRKLRLGGLSVPGEIDYRDPVEDGAVPLVPVWDRMDAAVSSKFRVKDFAARDGAPFARISPELVDVLERLSDHLETPVHITSAYRHPALNFTASVGGAVESRHMAGLAADIWVEGNSPFELAEAALDVQGCRIGVGLGAHYIHLDLREYTSSWAYEGAELAEADFDLWMLDRCADSFSEHARMLIEQRACAEPLTGPEAVEAYREDMRSLARHHRERRTSGAVLLDIRSDTAAVGGVVSRLAFLPVDSPLLRLMKLQEIVRRAEQNENFVFVVVDRDGAHRTGLMRYEGSEAPALDGRPEYAAPCE